MNAQISQGMGAVTSAGSHSRATCWGDAASGWNASKGRRYTAGILLRGRCNAVNPMIGSQVQQTGIAHEEQAVEEVRNLKDGTSGRSCKAFCRRVTGNRGSGVDSWEVVDEGAVFGNLKRGCLSNRQAVLIRTNQERWREGPEVE